MADAAKRQFRMLEWLPVGPNAPISVTKLKANLELADAEFVVTERTIQRDLNQLSTFLPIESNQNGWYVREGQMLLLPRMPEGVASVMALAKQHLDRLMPASLVNRISIYFDAADRRINDIKMKSDSIFLDKVAIVPQSIELARPSIDQNIMDVVWDAVESQKVLVVKRVGKDKQHIHPLGIVVKGPTIYIVCRFGTYDNIRYFPITQLESVEFSEEKFIKKEFSLQAYIASGKFGISIEAPDEDDEFELIARFYAGTGEHLKVTPFSSDQQLEDRDDYLEFTTPVKNTYALRWWLLGFGGNVEVMAPPFLRKVFKENIAEAHARYAKD